MSGATFGAERREVWIGRRMVGWARKTASGWTFVTNGSANGWLAPVERRVFKTAPEVLVAVDDQLAAECARRARIEIPPEAIMAAAER